MMIFVTDTQLYVRHLWTLAVLENTASSDEAKEKSEWHENKQVAPSFFCDTLLSYIRFE